MLFFNKVRKSIRRQVWSEYLKKNKLITKYGNEIEVEEATSNKVFNYYIQSLETETNIMYLYNLIKQDTIPILYTYDSMLFDVEEAEIGKLISVLKKTLKHKFSISIGDNLKNMKFEYF